MYWRGTIYGNRCSKIWKGRRQQQNGAEERPNHSVQLEAYTALDKTADG